MSAITRRMSLGKNSSCSSEKQRCHLHPSTDCLSTSWCGDNPCKLLVRFAPMFHGSEFETNSIVILLKGVEGSVLMHVGFSVSVFSCYKCFNKASVLWKPVPELNPETIPQWMKVATLLEVCSSFSAQFTENGKQSTQNRSQILQCCLRAVWTLSFTAANIPTATSFVLQHAVGVGDTPLPLHCFAGASWMWSCWRALFGFLFTANNSASTNDNPPPLSLSFQHEVSLTKWPTYTSFPKHHTRTILGVKCLNFRCFQLNPDELYRIAVQNAVQKYVTEKASVHRKTQLENSAVPSQHWDECQEAQALISSIRPLLSAVSNVEMATRCAHEMFMKFPSGKVSAFLQASGIACRDVSACMLLTVAVFLILGAAKILAVKECLLFSETWLEVCIWLFHTNPAGKMREKKPHVQDSLTLSDTERSLLWNKTVLTFLFFAVEYEVGHGGEKSQEVQRTFQAVVDRASFVATQTWAGVRQDSKTHSADIRFVWTPQCERCIFVRVGTAAW